MNEVKSHYHHHLGYFYSWMVGDFEIKSEEQKAFFQRNNIIPRYAKSAVDLGCGHGIQSVALARLGFNVTAIDFNKTLLNELNLKSIQGIHTIEDNLIDFDLHLRQAPELIVCMGDTLTHLGSQTEVITLLTKVREKLSAGGKLVLSFRDLSSPLIGNQRFLPVKSDENRIHTCFLEYFQDHVQVHDLLHERVDSQWKQKVSSYPKLILTSYLLNAFLNDIGLEVIHEEVINRMIHLIAMKK